MKLQEDYQIEAEENYKREEEVRKIRRAASFDAERKQIEEEKKEERRSVKERKKWEKVRRGVTV